MPRPAYEHGQMTALSSDDSGTSGPVETGGIRVIMQGSISFEE
jgi:hypothetical protein